MSLTVEDVRARVKEIATHAHDNEIAHSAEDALWERVLRAIARGAPNAQQLAQEAVKTKMIPFARWYA